MHTTVEASHEWQWSLLSFWAIFRAKLQFCDKFGNIVVAGTDFERYAGRSLVRIIAGSYEYLKLLKPGKTQAYSPLVAIQTIRDTILTLFGSPSWHFNFLNHWFLDLGFMNFYKYLYILNLIWSEILFIFQTYSK